MSQSQVQIETDSIYVLVDIVEKTSSSIYFFHPNDTFEIVGSLVIMFVGCIRSVHTVLKQIVPCRFSMFIPFSPLL